MAIGIALTKGQIAIVDDDRYAELNQHKWLARWSEDTQSYYATRMTGGRKNRKGEHMHRVVANAPAHLQVDHINGDTLDNRLENLRPATRRQNQWNRHGRKSSVYPGVSLHKRSNKWEARIMVNRKNFYLGSFTAELDAFKAYLKECVVRGFSIDILVLKFGINIGGD